MMRHVALCICLLGGVSLARADPTSDCFQLDSPDIKIAGCTTLIAVGSLKKGDLADAYISRASAYGATGNFAAAIADYGKAIDLDLGDPTLYDKRARAYSAKGDNDRAIVDATGAIGLEPENAAFLNDRAWIYFKAGKAAEALSDANKALDLRPNDPHTLDTRGHILEVLGQRQAAAADFRLALSLNSSLQSSRDALARLGVSP